LNFHTNLPSGSNKKESGAEENYLKPNKLNFNEQDNILRSSSNNKNSNNNSNFKPLFTNLNDKESDRFRRHKKISSLDILDSQVPRLNLMINERPLSEKKTGIFSKLDSLQFKHYPQFNSRENTFNNYIKDKSTSIGKITKTSHNSKNNFNFVLNSFNPTNNSKYINLENKKDIVLDSNFRTAKNQDLDKRSLNFDIIKNIPCKLNMFNNFKHLREEIDNSEFSLRKRNYLIVNKSNGNFTKSITKTEYDRDPYNFGKENNFILKSNIMNKIEATRRLKLFK